jgi:hypothetical protein
VDIHLAMPFRWETLKDHNGRMLMRRLGRRPPAEAETEYYAELRAGKHTGHT